MIRKTLQNRGIRFDEEVPPILAKWNTTTLGAKVKSIMVSLIKKPFRKLFRTFFFWLTVRDAGKTATESYLLYHFLNDQIGITANLDRDEAKKMAEAFSEAVRHSEKDVARKTWHQVWKRIRRQKKVGPVVRAETPGIVEQFNRRYRTALEAA